MILSSPRRTGAGAAASPYARDQDVRFFAVLGLLMWAIGTAIYRAAGPLFFEAAPIVYWLNVLLTAVTFCAALWAVLRARRVAPHGWLSAALAFALPGMAGEVIVLAHFSDVMIRMRAETAGRYSAYLFAGYTVFILFAGIAARREEAKTGASQSRTGR